MENNQSSRSLPLAGYSGKLEGDFGSMEDPSALLALSYPSYFHQEQHPTQPSPSQFFSSAPLASPAISSTSNQAGNSIHLSQDFLGPSRSFHGGGWLPIFSPPIVTPIYPQPYHESKLDNRRSLTAAPSYHTATTPGGFPFPPFMPSSSYRQPVSPSSHLLEPVEQTANQLLSSFLGGAVSPGLAPEFTPETSGNGFLGVRPPSNGSNQAYIFDVDDSGLNEEAANDQDDIEPERRMVNCNVVKMKGRSGAWAEGPPPESSNDPFWIPPERFLACYSGELSNLSWAHGHDHSDTDPKLASAFVWLRKRSSVEHWQMPPLWILSKVARRTFNQLNPHVPLIHPATFTLKDLPTPLAFAVRRFLYVVLKGVSRCIWTDLSLHIHTCLDRCAPLGVRSVDSSNGIAR